MLIVSLLAAPAEGALLVSKICGKDFTCDWMPVDESWEGCSHYDKHNQDGRGKSVSMVEKNSGDFSSLILPSCSQVSTSAIMSGSLTPLRVYHRKKLHTKSLDVCPIQTFVDNKNGDICHSATSSEAHSGATKEHLVSAENESNGVRSPYKPPVKRSTEGLASKSGSYNGFVDGEEPDEGFRIDIGRVLDICCMDDSCLSSKLNLDLVSASLKTDGDDTGECSSSGGFVSEGLWENMSEKDICISIIRSHGLVEVPSPLQDCVSVDNNAMSSDQNCCSRACKACGGSETSSKMLICDQCEDAFHTSCCFPCIMQIPIDKWFCYSCLKKKRKLLKEKSCNALANIKNEDEIGPIAHMLRDSKPFKSSVRVGHQYQVEDPDWSGPVIDENVMGEPEEITESEYLALHGENSYKTLWQSSIGNWLQCQEVIEGIGEGIDGTICGKWCSHHGHIWKKPYSWASLSEVQTDGWECFGAVLWDPILADCAVPQELPTDEVLKQLKYREMLRSRLAAKKRKLDQTKIGDSEVPKEG